MRQHDPDKLRAALRKLEASRDLREIATPANGWVRQEVDGRVILIHTGVPRSDGEPRVKREPSAQAAVDYAVDFPANYVIPDDPPSVHLDQPPTDFYISISEWEICQAAYEIRDDCVIVTRGDETLGSEQLRPGDDPGAVAKRLLRKSKGSTGFGRRLDYGPMGIV